MILALRRLGIGSIPLFLSQPFQRREATFDPAWADTIGDSDRLALSSVRADHGEQRLRFYAYSRCS